MNDPEATNEWMPKSCSRSNTPTSNKTTGLKLYSVSGYKKLFMTEYWFCFLHLTHEYSKFECPRKYLIIRLLRLAAVYTMMPYDT